VKVPSSGERRDAALSVSGRSVTSLRDDPGDVVVIPRKGLQFMRRVPFERWLNVGKHLSDVYTSSAWCLGDWLAYGERIYSGRYRDAIEQTSLDYQTLRNYAWVAKRFSLSRRRDTLSLGHHAEVAALPETEQDFWLRKAEELGWSVKLLRFEVRKSLGERSPDEGSADERGGLADDNQPDLPSRAEYSKISLTIYFTPEQWQTCQSVAGGAGLTVDAWASRALDQAARQWVDASLRSCATG
jgi:hypothetical protein